jgi:hypothetical protein
MAAVVFDFDYLPFSACNPERHRTMLGILKFATRNLLAGSTASEMNMKVLSFALLFVVSLDLQATPSLAQGGLSMDVVYLDGRGAHVVLPPSIFDRTREATVEAWVRWERFNKWARVFDFGREGNAVVLQSEKSSTDINFAIYDRDGKRYRIRKKKAVKERVWYHVAATCGPQGMKLYVNGQLAGSDRFTGGLDEGAGGQNFVGRSNWEDDEYLQGHVAEFRVWD